MTHGIQKEHHIQNITIFSEKEYIKAIREAEFEICERLSEEQFRMRVFVEKYTFDKQTPRNAKKITCMLYKNYIVQ